ncbi:MAG: proteasome assembly chaperone family protein [Acidimicrobiales bacterium]
MTFVTRYPVTPPERPVLIVVLDGWVDAGFGAATAIAAILSEMKTETLATFQGDELIDQRARRPRLRIDDGVRAGISWPELQVLVGRDRIGSGVALLIGPEPDYRWRPFTAEVVALARELDVRLVVSLGAFPNATPHTRPIRLAATASEPELARRVGVVRGSIEVPAGIGEVIGEACVEAGIPSVGLWARVPHYVAAMPFAPAALALVEGLCAISGLVIGTDGLERSAEEARRQVDDLIAQSPDHVAMVRQMEEHFDTGGETILDLEGELPTGDEIASELERYLRDEST